MKIHDISQEVFACEVYPGDPKPKKNVLSSMKNGDLYNLTAFSMCAHNGTHVMLPITFTQTAEPLMKCLWTVLWDMPVSSPIQAASRLKMLKTSSKRLKSIVINVPSAF